MWWLFTFADDTRVCFPNALKQQVASLWTLKTCLIIICSVNILNVSHHLILEQGRLLIGRLSVAIVDIWAENKTLNSPNSELCFNSNWPPTSLHFRVADMLLFCFLHLNYESLASFGFSWMLQVRTIMEVLKRGTCACADQPLWNIFAEDRELNSPSTLH